MRIQNSFSNDCPTLYLVATPIGNLTEFSPRAIEILNSVDIVAAEDTRNGKKLLDYFDIKKKLISHHEHNSGNSTKGIIDLLQEGNNVALISDAGYPLMCDPGTFLVDQAIEKGFNVVTINGPSAMLCALTASGISPHPFYFHGFLPHNVNEGRRQLEKLKSFENTMVFYESVHRIINTLQLMLEVLGDRKICVARELTKIHEQFLTGVISEVIDNLTQIKGEFVIVIEGNKELVKKDINEDLVLEIDQLVSSNLSVKEAIKEISKKYGLSKNEVYQFYHQEKE
ncbi:MAG: 16S rRNA (cytidine(1402)-2'-O)-methyltransferase [Erysipelotrichaceae bacterium]